MFSHAQIWQGLDKLAAKHGYSPSGLARAAGLDPTSFNKSKRISPDGKPRWLSTESLSKILHVTGSTMSDFIALLDQPTFAPLSIAEKKTMAHTVASTLLETESVLFYAQTPFTLKSGRKSPVYVDCRRLISFIAERDLLMDYAARLIHAEIGPDAFDTIAGGETAGIPYAAFIAQRLKKPMVYVRKQPKGYGRMAQIEGLLPEKNGKGKRTRALLVEDLQTDGGSKKVFVDALRAAGADVGHAFVLFHYGIFPASERNMKEIGIKLHALCTWWDVLSVAKEQKAFDAATLKSVEAFLKHPVKWQDDHEG
jgi:orotate phosphoribosyltransferase